MQEFWMIMTTNDKEADKSLIKYFGPFTAEGTAKRVAEDYIRGFVQDDIDDGWTARVVKLQRHTNGYRNPVGCEIKITLEV